MSLKFSAFSGQFSVFSGGFKNRWESEAPEKLGMKWLGRSLAASPAQK